MKKLAIIILNWNGEELLRKLLPVITSHCVSDESDLIVADNGSSDGSVEFVRRNFPQVRVMAFPENYGFAEGYNKAMEACRDYPYALLLNSDVETTPGWWRPLLAFMEAHPEAGAVQPKIRSYHQRDMFEYAGAAGGYIDSLGYPYCRGRLFESLERDEGQYDGAPAEVAWASGAALLTRTELYLRLGGLDKDFFAHMEEIDYCCRLIASGYKVYAVPDSYVFHMGGASLAQGNPKKTYLNFRNNLLLLHKNLPVREGKRLLFLRRLADTLAFGMNLLKLDFANAGAIVKAHRDFRKMRGNYTRHPERNFMKELPGAERNIVFEHFVLRRKR